MNDYKYLDENNFELHYFLNNESHIMDATIQNKCEYEFLNIVREIALFFEVELIVNTEPLAEGGIKRWYSLIVKEENKRATIKIAVISSLVTGVFITPLTTAISKTVEIGIERLLESQVEKENKELDIEEKKLRIEKLKLDIQEKVEKIEGSHKVKKRKSNFYSELNKEPNIIKVSFSVENKRDKSTIVEEKIIEKTSFVNFILQSNKLENSLIENAYIEIISPVLKKGKYKWKGIYDDSTISFSMKSNEFKNLVQQGTIEFKNGSAIICDIEVEKELNNDGDEIITSLNVVRVLNFIEKGELRETPEGKKQRESKVAQKNQYKLFE
jgi:hypothetical protein